MCRIAGIFHLGCEDIQEVIVRMRESMKHGGPDGSGIFIDSTWPLALGHRRLSLIDLSPAGHQPMIFKERALTIVFNGEIYNFKEIRQTLISRGYTFQTSSDTEVILKAYDFWGVDCFEFFNGMFALVIWDEKKQELILARDHAGIKPLYYYHADGIFLFASEIRAFHKSSVKFNENTEWKTAFLAFGHLPEPITILKGVVPLEKGTALIVSIPSLRIQKHVFFKWSFSSDLLEEEEACSLMRNTIQQAVERHMIADAPLGLFLSGGIDSSILTFIAAQKAKALQTLSIIFNENKFTEKKYQQLIIQKTQCKHTFYLVTKEDFKYYLSDSFSAMDLPSLDGINTYFISKYARTNGLKAVLSGLGADEIFGGYPSFKNQVKFNLLKFFPDRLLLSVQHIPDYRIRKIAYAGIQNSAAEYLLYRGIFTPKTIARILGAYQNEIIQSINKIGLFYSAGNLEKGNRISWLETNYYMQNQLLKDADYMSMWNGIELRVPFLDKEVMMLAAQINPVIKFNGSFPKYMLVKPFLEDLPEQIWNRKKQGFTFPFEGWLKENDFSMPVSSMENAFYEKFKKDKISWSRYWCYILMNRFSDKIKYAA